MKKIIVISFLFIMASSTVFAQFFPDGITMSFWGQIAFVPLEIQFNQEESEYLETKQKIRTGIGPSWGLQPNGRAANLMFNGNSDYIGFGVEIEADIEIRLGEYAYIWAKPFMNDFLRLDAGVFMNHMFRGTRSIVNFAKFGLSAGTLAQDMDLNDAIFNRFAVKSIENEAGALLTITPVYGLNIAAFMRVQNSTLEAGPKKQIGPMLGSSVDRIQVAAGYKIQGAGFIRAQFINAPEFEFTGITTSTQYGGRFERNDFNLYYNYFKRIEAAFQLTAVQGLPLDIGVKIPFPESNNNIDYSAPFVAALGTGYGFENFFCNLAFISWFGGGINSRTTDYKFAPMFAVNLNPTYNFGFATVGATIGMDYKGTDTANGNEIGFERMDLGFTLYIMKKFSKGNIQAGFSYTMLDITNDRPGTRETGYFRIPLIMEIEFF